MLHNNKYFSTKLFVYHNDIVYSLCYTLCTVKNKLCNITHKDKQSKSNIAKYNILILIQIHFKLTTKTEINLLIFIF